MIKLDLHIHSYHSFDSDTRPQEILRAANQAGLNGIAVTDHDTIRGGVETQIINQDPNFLVIVGAEIKTDMGDILGLFLTQEVKSNSALEVIEEIHRQGGLAILPHPYTDHPPYQFEHLDLDGIEVYNARSTDAKNAAAMMLAHYLKLPIVNGSDAHFAEEIGRAPTYLNLTLSQLSQINPDSLLKHTFLSLDAPIYTPTYLRYKSQMIKCRKQRHLRGYCKSLLMFLLLRLKTGVS